MEDKKIIEQRLIKLREKLLEKGIDAALVAKRENYMYLSGFTGTAAHLIITHNHAILVTDFRYVEQATTQAPLFEVIKYQGNLTDAINDILTQKGVKTLGFEESYLTYERYNECKTKFNINDFVPLEGIIERLRMIKDSAEIEIIQKAVEIADNAFTHILGFIKPGVSEIEIAAELEYFMKKQGASGASFQSIIASGERSSMPHGVASMKKIQSGDSITLDFGALYNNYCSDMTRTVFLGEPNKELKKIYETVLEAQLESIKGAKKGLTGKDIDSIARDIISREGHANNFGHGLGHGVGLEIHEDPRLSPAGNDIMENNMVVTVEPGIYVNGLGGVRIEDIIVISDDNPIVLTKSTKDIVIL